MPDLTSVIILMRPGVLAISAVLLGIAALHDIATRTIPDLVPVSLVVIGIAIHLTDGNVLAALGASAAVFLLAGLCWRFGWLGGGDVKLLAACASLVPATLVPQFVLTTAIAGGVLACLYLVLGWMVRVSRTPTRSARPRSLTGRVWRAERWRIGRRAALPYGCAIAAATLLTLSGR